MTDLPDFDALPAVPGMPQGCAWGLFDKERKDGQKDRLGCLNKLTPAIAAAAASSEVRDGISVSLNWPLDAFKMMGPMRKPLVHRHLTQGAARGVNALDDELEFNTQVSSQWDSLVHFPHQPSGLSYNGVKPTVDALAASSSTGAEAETETETGSVDAEWPTLTSWHQRGGLVGRGVLLDYRAYAEANDIHFSPFKPHAITVDDLEAVAAFQGTEFKIGDVLLVRTGYTEDIEGRSEDEQRAIAGMGASAGLRGHVDTARWAWNRHFAAIAADNPALEQFPPMKDDGSTDDIGNLGTTISYLPLSISTTCIVCRTLTAVCRYLVLHTYFLALFGLHIGELWDLKQLSRVCREKKRYSFLLTSMPLNAPCLVGSPPNALAIF